MNFTQKTLTTLEFDKICEMLADCAPTSVNLNLKSRRSKLSNTAGAHFLLDKSVADTLRDAL